MCLSPRLLGPDLVEAQITTKAHGFDDLHDHAIAIVTKTDGGTIIAIHHLQLRAGRGLEYYSTDGTTHHEHQNNMAYDNHLCRGLEYYSKDGTTRHYRCDGNVVLMVGARGSYHDNQPPTDPHNGAVFLLDSGASIHLSGNFPIFSSLWKMPPGRFVRTANGQSLAIIGYGSIILDGFRLKDVMFVPGLKHNLVSVSKLTELDYSVEFRGAHCLIRDTRSGADGALVGKGRRTGGGLYELDYLEVSLDRSLMA